MIDNRNDKDSTEIADIEWHRVKEVRMSEQTADMLGLFPINEPQPFLGPVISISNFILPGVVVLIYKDDHSQMVDWWDFQTITTITNNKQTGFKWSIRQ